MPCAQMNAPMTVAAYTQRKQSAAPTHRQRYALLVTPMRSVPMWPASPIASLVHASSAFIATSASTSPKRSAPKMRAGHVTPMTNAPTFREESTCAFPLAGAGSAEPTVIAPMSPKASARLTSASVPTATHRTTTSRVKVPNLVFVFVLLISMLPAS